MALTPFLFVAPLLVLFILAVIFGSIYEGYDPIMEAENEGSRDTHETRSQEES